MNIVSFTYVHVFVHLNKKCVFLVSYATVISKFSYLLLTHFCFLVPHILESNLSFWQAILVLCERARRVFTLKEFTSLRVRISFSKSL